MTRFHVIALVVVLSVATCWYITATDLGFSAVHLHDILRSDVVSSEHLALMRLTFAVVIVSTLYAAISDKKGLEITVSLSGGGFRTVNLQRFERLSTFTMWCWTLQGVYFFLASLSSVMSSETLESIHVDRICWVLFEINFALAYLVTVLVTFVLIPGAISKKIPHKFFDIIPILCHNANALFMGIEISLNKLSMPFSHIAFIQLFGLIYVIFAWKLHNTNGIFYYFFLDYDRPYAVWWYVGLFLSVCCLYFLCVIEIVTVSVSVTLGWCVLFVWRSCKIFHPSLLFTDSFGKFNKAYRYVDTYCCDADLISFRYWA